MANRVGVTSVWAEYGVALHRDEYALLRDVTHWTDETVAREKQIAESQGLSERDLQPALTLRHSIAELLDLFDFCPAKDLTDAGR